MKNKLQLQLRARLRSVGLEITAPNVNRLLNFVVERSNIHQVLAQMTPEDVFKATRPEEKKGADARN